VQNIIPTLVQALSHENCGTTQHPLPKSATILVRMWLYYVWIEYNLIRALLLYDPFLSVTVETLTLSARRLVYWKGSDRL
jgi:hypothetical protein